MRQWVLSLPKQLRYKRGRYAAASVLWRDLTWVWLALFGDNLARAVLKLRRFQSGRWGIVRGRMDWMPCFTAAYLNVAD